MKPGTSRAGREEPQRQPKNSATVCALETDVSIEAPSTHPKTPTGKNRDAPGAEAAADQQTCLRKVESDQAGRQEDRGSQHQQRYRKRGRADANPPIAVTRLTT